MRIVQISDSHISVKNPARTADLANCIMAINDISPAVDLVVHTGDIVHDGPVSYTHLTLPTNREV